MRPSFTVVALVLALAAAACSGSPASPSSPNTALRPPSSSSSSSVTGTWVGTAADMKGTATTGTVMGMSMMSGMGAGMMGSGSNMTWYITQTGDTFTGTVGFTGVQCATGMTMNGTFSGNGGSFTIAMPAESMSMAGCSGNATGTFTVDPTTGEMHGTYSGTSTCMGNFSGQATLVRK